MFSTPGMGLMDTWIFALQVIHVASRRRELMAVDVLTLPRRAQISAALLSTAVVMCLSGFMRWAKMLRCGMYAVSSRSLIVRNPFGF